MAKKLALNSKIGVLGEDIAARFLMKHGFSIKFRNYWKKWGEIDIVAQKRDKTYFIEVKSVSCENISHNCMLSEQISNKKVTHETKCSKNPAENVDERKLAKIKRAIQSYIGEYKIKGEWEIYVLSVHINKTNKTAFVEVLDREII